MSAREHWQSAYDAKPATELSWYVAHLRESLRLIERVAPPAARILDVGGGASTLVDDLLARGYGDVTVLDIAESALEIARQRLGERASRVRWLTGDVTKLDLGRDRFDLWHDRAVFHFLTSALERAAYRERLQTSLAAGGHAVIATFSLAGPTKCSGLEVVRYDAETLSLELGDAFKLIEHAETLHVTPAGREQAFVHACFQKLA